MLAVWKLARQHSHINSEVSVHQSHSLTQSAGRESRAASPATEATQHTALISHTRRRVRCESDNY